MKRTLHRWLLLISLTLSLADKDPELPLCPTNMQFFPQNLPMHCRMPGNSESGSFPELPQYPTLPPLPQSFYQSPSPDKLPPPVPIPIPPFPGIPGAMPGPMGGPMPPPMPGMPMPMPMVGGPPHKLPVIVMPFYSPDNSFKKQHLQNRPPKKKPPRKSKKSSHDSDTDTSSEETSGSGGKSDDSESSSEHGFWKGRRKARRKMTRRMSRRHRMRRKERRNKKKDLLTPILQYVTKDGYVIFEKKISNSEAKDWLKPKSEVNVVEEGRHDEVNIIQKSIEEPPKGPPEPEVHATPDDKSFEMSETEATTHRPKMKHRPKKVNTLISKLDP